MTAYLYLPKGYAANLASCFCLPKDYMEDLASSFRLPERGVMHRDNGDVGHPIAWTCVWAQLQHGDAGQPLQEHVYGLNFNMVMLANLCRNMCMDSNSSPAGTRRRGSPACNMVMLANPCRDKEEELYCNMVMMVNSSLAWRGSSTATI